MQLIGTRDILHANFTQSLELYSRYLESRNLYTFVSMVVDINTTALVACITLDSNCVQELSLFVQYKEIVERYYQSKGYIAEQYAYALK